MIRDNVQGKNGGDIQMQDNDCSVIAGLEYNAPWVDIGHANCNVNYNCADKPVGIPCFAVILTFLIRLHAMICSQSFL